MKKLIVNSLEMICKITIVLILISTSVIVYSATKSLGLAILGIIIAFLVCTLCFGALFVLLEINDNIRAIRKHFVKSALRDIKNGKD